MCVAWGEMGAECAALHGTGCTGRAGSMRAGHASRFLEESACAVWCDARRGQRRTSVRIRTVATQARPLADPTPGE